MSGFRSWVAILFLVRSVKAVSGFRSWLLWKSILESQDVACGLPLVGAWIMDADPVDQAQFLEPGEVFVYALLADALTRVKEPQQAVEILGEGLTAFPEDAGLRRRLALAHAAAGQRQEALPLLTAWVEQHPEDNEALMTTLAVLFDGFSREAAGAVDTAERARLVRFARAYVEGSGPNREIIGRWLKYLTAGS